MMTHPERLLGVHLDLVKVVNLAATKEDFIVLEGLRSKERQQMLFNRGASQTLKSRHLTGHAVDLGVLIGGVLSWFFPLYKQQANVFKACAKELSVPIEWGGDWQSLKDGPHFQLPFKEYPV